MTEEKALALLKDRNPEGLEWFIRRYTPYVSTVIWNIIGKCMPVQDAEELCSDVFLSLWRNTTYAKGNYFLEWDLDNGVYFDEVDCGYRADSNESAFLFMGYVRYYADEGRAESVTRAQFEASRDYLARETVTVNGREAYFVGDSYRTTLTWLDEDRGLVFNLSSDSWNTPPLSQTELIDLAQQLMDGIG